MVQILQLPVGKEEEKSISDARTLRARQDWKFLPHYNNIAILSVFISMWKKNCPRAKIYNTLFGEKLYDNDFFDP